MILLWGIVMPPDKCPTTELFSYLLSSTVRYIKKGTSNVTCSAIWGLFDKDDELRVSHELLNTERIS